MKKGRKTPTKERKHEVGEVQGDLFIPGWIECRPNAFHGGLDERITPLHGALALEIDWSRWSFRGSCGNFTAGYGREEFSQRINTCDISSYHCAQGNTWPTATSLVPELNASTGEGRRGGGLSHWNYWRSDQFALWCSFLVCFFFLAGYKNQKTALCKVTPSRRVTGGDQWRTCVSHQGFQEREEMYMRGRAL